ncbi:hypothetical protein TNCV_1096901 [Trichonephila clavipes]|nr:hypothetical protein TNCV_1096901 [Trichonephila clavipes]
MASVLSARGLDQSERYVVLDNRSGRHDMLRDQGRLLLSETWRFATALQEWNSIPGVLIDNLIASMANRCAARSAAVRGDHTPLLKLMHHI